MTEKGVFEEEEKSASRMIRLMNGQRQFSPKKTTSGTNAIKQAVPNPIEIREKYERVRQIFIILRITHKMLSHISQALIRWYASFISYAWGCTIGRKSWKPLL